MPNTWKIKATSSGSHLLVFHQYHIHYIDILLSSSQKDAKINTHTPITLPGAPLHFCAKFSTLPFALSLLLNYGVNS